MRRGNLIHCKIPLPRQHVPQPAPRNPPPHELHEFWVAVNGIHAHIGVPPSDPDGEVPSSAPCIQHTYRVRVDWRTERLSNWKTWDIAQRALDRAPPDHLADVESPPPEEEPLTPREAHRAVS